MTTPNKTPNKLGQAGRLSSSKASLSTLTPSSSSVANGGARPSLAPLTPSASLQHSQSLHETFTVLGELTHEFKNTADECALISKLLSKKKEIEEVLRNKQSEMKELVATLTQQCDTLQALTSQPPSRGLQQQQAVITQQKNAITAQINSMLSEIERLEASGVEMEKQKAQLLQQKAESEAAKAKRMPSMAGTMGLYRNFSSLAWDYDADADTTVKGTFHFDRTNSIKSFNFDRKAMSDFDIANSLWEMMEAAQ